jgi:hypothetical protein
MADKKTKLEKIREKPGMSNAGKYPNVKQSDFAGPNGTYPINTLKRAKSALRLAHFSNDSTRIKKNVYKRYPALDPEIGVQSKSPLAYSASPFPLKKERIKNPIQEPPYKKGDSMDETDFENLNSGLNIQDVNSIIEEDKESQFITSKKGGDGPYPSNTQRQDTIRPKNGKFFKR